jgi:hypothetical protein
MKVDRSSDNNVVRLMRDDGSPLNSGGGGGNYSGMEPRVAALEADMKEIKSDLKKVLVDLSYLRGKVDAMPSTLQLIGFAIAIFVAAGVTRFFGH